MKGRGLFIITASVLNWRQPINMGLAHACFEAHCIAMKRVITAIFDGILCCVRVGAKTGRREGDYRSSGGAVSLMVTDSRRRKPMFRLNLCSKVANLKH